MKKLIIGALAGAFILFVWQFLSWGLLGLHQSETQHTSNQDAIMQVLNDNLEEGTYFLPNVPEGSSKADSQKYMEDVIGKPWATISYHKSMSNNMGMNMFRGFTVDFIALLLLCWLLMKFENFNFKTSVLASLAIGLIGFLTLNYTNSIWFEGSTIASLIDTVVSWGIIGAWLGWWLNR